MKSSTHLIRLTRVLILGAVVAGTVASVAGAVVSRPPDVRDAASSIGQAYLGSPPDVRDVAATTNLAVADAFERYAAAHPYGSGLSSASLSTPVDRIIAQEQGRQADLRLFSLGLSTPTSSTLVSRPPDVRDAAATANLQVSDVFERYATAHPYGAGLSEPTSSTLVNRPPDVRDAAQAAKVVSVSQTSGFDWGDYAIGIGSGMGLTLILGSGLVMGRQRRNRVLTA
jgi:hypothetical protein